MFTRQIAQIIFELIIEGRPLNAGRYMAFTHSISFATDLAANFGCNRFRITPDIVSKLLRAAIWSHCAVQFESEQTPFPRTGGKFSLIIIQSRGEFQTCCFAQDLIWNMLFGSYVIFLLRDQWLIERLSDAMGAALVGSNSLPIPPKFSFHSNFHMKKKVTCCRQKFQVYKALKPCWLLSWVSITRVVAYFPQASRLRLAATAAY